MMISPGGLRKPDSMWIMYKAGTVVDLLLQKSEETRWYV